MRKAALILALVFGLDIVADSLDSACLDVNEQQTCHACVCQIHAVTSAPTAVRVAPTAPPFALATAPGFAARVSDKSFFQPPKSLA